MAPVDSSPVTLDCRVIDSNIGQEAGRTVVWLRGDHDASNVVALRETVAKALALEDADFVIDLSEVEFLGAATVGVIIRTAELLRGRNRALAVRAPSLRARRILDLCGLTDLVDLGPSEAHP